MARWTEGARERLQEAALALYSERGYANTTVAEVAARAGLTERTYFRHFPDKQEVLFADDEALVTILLGAVQDAPAGAGAWELATGALRALALELEPRREEARMRGQVLASDEALRERDVAKQARSVLALQGAMQARGVDAGHAALAAGVAGAIFGVAYTAWLSDPGGPDLIARLNDAIADLRHVAPIR